jgi:hypothetical protein
VPRDTIMLGSWTVQRAVTKIVRAHGFARRTAPGEWQQAIEAIERSQTIARERRTSLENEPWRLVRLAESHLALGDPERARTFADEGLAMAQSRGQAGLEALGSVTLARALLGSPGQAGGAEVDAALDRAMEIAHERN